MAAASMRALQRAAGIAPTRPSPPWEPRRARVQKMLEAGASVDQVAAAEQLTPRQVRVMLAGMSPDDTEASDADIVEGIAHSPTPSVR